MTFNWRADVPDSTYESGNDIRITVDAGRRVHLAYVVNNYATLRYAIGTPPPPFKLGGSMPVANGPYQWATHDVMPWSFGRQFDLAVDSEGTAHLCFQGFENQDHMTLGDVQHAMWD